MHPIGSEKAGAYPLAQFAATCTLADIPERIQNRAALYITDTLGCMILGASADSSQVMRNYAALEGTGSACTLIGSKQRASASVAPLVNAVAGHAFDMDDVGTAGHASTVILAAILAAAEETQASGAQLLEAFCIGMEVSGKVYKVLMSDDGKHYARGWHTTSTAGPVGAAAGCAHLYQLNEEQTLNAICNAADLSFGLKKSFGSMTKHINAGYAAQAGIVSAKLAGHGLQSNPAMLDGPCGFFDCFCDQYDKTKMEKIGEVWTLDDPRIQKLYASCGFAQRSTCAILDHLAELPTAVGNIQKIEIALPDRESAPLQYTLPQTGTEASFSAEYGVAAALIDRVVTLRSYDDDMVTRPEVQALMGKMERKPFPGAAYSGLLTITIEYADGSRKECTCKDFAGGFTSPLTEEQLHQKFLDCAAHGIDAERCADVFNMAIRMKELPDICALTSLISASARY